MFKIEGLDELQRELGEAVKALEQVTGDLGTVSFDPEDPGSTDAAITKMNQMIDQRLAGYADNRIVAPLIEQAKESFREEILKEAAAARLKGNPK